MRSIILPGWIKANFSVYKCEEAFGEVLMVTCPRNPGKQVDTGEMTRFYFNGLTEEIKKESIGSHALSSFVIDWIEDGDSDSEWDDSDGNITVTGGVVDSARRSDVIRTERNGILMKFSGAWIGDNVANTENANDTPWDSTDRIVSFWYKDGGDLVFYGENSSGVERWLTYRFSDGTNGLVGNHVNIYLGASMQTSTWKRIERDLKADFEAYSTDTWSEVDGLRIVPGTSPLTSGLVDYLYIDDLRLCDAMTVEHNVLGPGVIGHILRHRTINTSTYAATDAWFAYDQVGSVLSRYNSSGNQTSRNWKDSLGNVLQSYSTGLWSNSASGWHYNTKEIDDDAGLDYMHQRWYDGHSGTFSTMSPFPPDYEGRYNYAALNPVSVYDSRGLDLENNYPYPVVVIDSTVHYDQILKPGETYDGDADGVWVPYKHCDGTTFWQFKNLSSWEGKVFFNDDEHEVRPDGVVVEHDLTGYDVVPSFDPNNPEHYKEENCFTPACRSGGWRKNPDGKDDNSAPPFSIVWPKTYPQSQ